MDNEIGTYSMILSKTQFGKSGSECPTKTIILAMNELIAVDNASTYGSLECVRIRDVRRKTVEWNYYLSVSPTSISADAGNSMHTIRITSYKKRVVDGVEESAQTAVSWDYDWNANWISPSGNPTSTSISFYTNENTTTSTRRDNVIITQAESGKTATVSVVQDAGDVSDNYYLEVDPTSMSFGASGGTKSYTVSSYKKQVINGVEQSGSTDVGWSANVTGSGFSYTSTDVTASANSGSARTGTLKITQDESKYWEEISLSQDAQAISYYFSVSDWQKSVVAAGGTTDAITITSTKTENGSTSNIGWSIDSSTLPSWLTWNASSMTFTATANTSTSSREQRIYFEQNESGNRDYAMVTQAGAAAPDNYVFTWSDGTTAQKSLTPDSAATTGSYDLVSTKNGSAHLWDVSSNVSWITTEKASSTRLSYSVTANTGSSRTGIITASQSESGKTLVIQIVQASGAVTPDVYVFTWDNGSTSDAPVNFNNTGTQSSSGSVISTKNGSAHGWSISSNASWLTATKTGDRFTVSASANTSSSRSGVVTFTQADSGKVLKMNVKQAGNPKVRFSVECDNVIIHTQEWDVPSVATTEFASVDLPADAVLTDSLHARLEVINQEGISWTGNTRSGRVSSFYGKVNTNDITNNVDPSITFTVDWSFSSDILLYEFTFNGDTVTKTKNVGSSLQNFSEIINSKYDVFSKSFSVKSKPSWIDIPLIALGGVPGRYDVDIRVGENTSTTASRSGDIVFQQDGSFKEITYTVTQEAATAPEQEVTLTLQNTTGSDIYPFYDEIDSVEALAPGEFTPAVNWGSDGVITIKHLPSQGFVVNSNLKGGSANVNGSEGSGVWCYITEPIQGIYFRLLNVGRFTLSNTDQREELSK